MKLLTKLMLQMVIVVIIVSSVLGVGSFLVTSDSMQNTIEDSLQTETRLRKQQIELKLDALMAVTDVMAYDDAVVSALKTTSTASEKNSAMKFFASILSDNQELIEMIALVDNKGKMLVTDSSTSVDIDIKDRVYFKELMETGSAVISDVVISKSSGEPVVVVASPLKKGSKVDGLVLATIRFDSIRSIIKEVKIGEAGYGYMTDMSGLVISHALPEKEFDLNIFDIAAGNAPFATVVDQMMTQEFGDGFYNYDGVDKYVAFARVENWVIALTANYDDYMAPVFKIRTMTLVIAFVIALLSVVATFFFTQSNIIKPIKKLEASMAAAGSGDLTKRMNLKGKDEISSAAHSFNDMVEKQTKMISDIQRLSETLNQTAEEMSASSQEVSATSEEITASIVEIAEGAQTQVESVNHTNEVLAVLRDGIESSAALVNDALSASKSCTEEAETGKNQLADSMDGMDAIRGITDTTVTQLHSLTEQTEIVSTISETIQAIANQINLLALNASIEAARAGEHGRGFSVVAEEVRKLAEQTTHESTQIASSLQNIVSTVTSTNEVVEDMKTIVTSGSTSISKTQEALERLYLGVESMIALNESVLYSNQKEIESVEVVVENMKALYQLSNKISAGAQEITSGSEEQAAITESLSQVAEETSKMAENMLLQMSAFTL
ncbi:MULTISPECIES: methyl-accepting chemotaxis protein [unclassified Fusibacter]|uniref:methyl-accepting chemotaxis protein n=1 Tax=unclassified Fusibacter TaxID=2624464 RepID=UPI0013E97494|nr:MULTISPECIES: methyl-accepting chemotaxis protein [unclassified Fusibacter]MCK8058006.1 methyl-accepting chemotaxis protein [Fusibacter sp. A2]NPE20588.1 methyl-accepting chemotaxis protein [Fusibacter sp. A1]